MGMAEHLIANRKNIVRISPFVGDQYEIVRLDEIQSLKGLGASEARKALPSLRALFFEEPVSERFTPFHS
jgi:hypothetical protein